jgi:hypothetical protein
MDTKTKIIISQNTYSTHRSKERATGYKINGIPLARKPVAPVTKTVLFSRNLGMLSTSMIRKEMRERERERVDE